MKIKLGNQEKDGGPQKPPQEEAIEVPAPSEAPKPTPRGVHPEFKHRAAKVVGVIYVVTGVIGVIIATVAHVMMRDGCGFAIHGGYLFAIITGGLGIGAAYKKKHGLIVAFLVFAIFTLVMSMHAPVKSMSDLRARHHGRDGHPHHARHGVHSREQDSSEERDDDDDSREKLDRDARDHHMRGKPMHSGSMHGKPVHGKPMHGKPMHGMSWEQMMKMKELFRKECKNRKWGKEGKGHWDEWLKKQMAAKVESKDNLEQQREMKPKPQVPGMYAEKKQTDRNMPPARLRKMRMIGGIALILIHVIHFVVSIVAIVLSCQAVGCCRKIPRRDASEDYKVPSPVVINVDATAPLPEELAPKVLAEQG